METYTIAGILFIRDEFGTFVEVSFGDASIGSFSIPKNADRQQFIAACESFFDSEMVFA